MLLRESVLGLCISSIYRNVPENLPCEPGRYEPDRSVNLIRIVCAKAVRSIRPFRTEQNKMLDGLGGRFVWRSARWVFGVKQLAPDGTPPPLEVFRKKSH